MTVQHQSYFELKKDVGEEFARKTLLYNLKCSKNNVRATVRTMRCSPHTVYLAMEKRNQGNLKDWFCGKAFLQLIIWWQKIYNLARPHQGLGNLTPYERLKSLGYVTGKAICLFPPLILDYVCCLGPFIIKKKGVQDHLDHDL